MINHPAGPPVQPGIDPEDPSLLGEIGARAIRARDAIPGGGRPRQARPLVLLAAFVCAACGLVYELELVALGGYLLGDSMTQTSVVLSVMVFAMGVGSLLAKRLTRRPAMSFALVECALALIGGLSVLVLYSCWAWLDQYRATMAGMVGMTFVIGTLIGAEIPLLMTLIQRIRQEDAGRAAADLFAADYVGALIGGLAFPFLLLPSFGQATGALLTGAVNAVAGAAVVLWLFRDEPPPRARLLLWTGCGLVLVTLAVAAAFTGAIERAARQALYGAHVRFATQSRYQEIVLAGPARLDPVQSAPERVPPQWTGPRPAAAAPLELFLDGRLAVCGPDEYSDHEALVHPALAAGPSGRVLVLGGEGLALREVLRHSAVRSVLVVELDPALPALVRSDPALAALSERAFDDPRVRLVTADPLEWLRLGHPAGDQPFDAVIADLPGPGQGRSRTFESQEFYGLAARLLAPGGRLAVRTGPVGPGLWSAEAGLRTAGLRTVPYEGAEGARHCRRSTKAGQTFVLAGREEPPLGLAADAPQPRSLTIEGLRASAQRLAARRPAHPPAPRTLLG
ncbi:polyamine aminopropyltransferase [Kitasatospora atroaurantiaca]|uniref:Polyamine aminopropyltransferase n=1 Tax=Kitasatospora atroaurantiaca TaxID=285545 RepID=A0A561ESC8_9ACTN|nr:spermidine synthase [Kitasatospora atroaurantiaca]TWE18506.1 spermidine synthase [Kitasatospora atroaurantiaca]